MQDVHNLAWKLAAVWRGRAGTSLLDTYAEEREPVGRRIAEETGAAWARVFGGTGAPFAGRSLAQLDMGYQYRSAAVCDDGGPDADPPGADYRPSAAPGCRAPHLWIGGRSTIDLFDRRPVLLTAPGGGDWRDAVQTTDADSHVIQEAAWPGLYGVTETGAVLVRPDGHVAWRAPAGGDGVQLERALRAVNP